MENIKLENLWKSYDQKIEKVLTINKEIAVNLARQSFNKQINRLSRPKWIAVIIGVPYAFLMLVITFITFMAEAYFAALGFGAIALIMILLLLSYFHQLYLVSQVKNNEDILSTQQQLSQLKLSSYNSLKLTIFQLPFWSICWVSLEALRNSPIIYGGINLLVFFILTYIAYKLYHSVSHKNKDSAIRDFFLSGAEWEPILKSAEILEQIKEYGK